MSVAWVGVGVAAVGAISQYNAAGNAADAQQAGTDATIAENRRQYDQNVALQMPAIDAGNTARNRLLYGLGLSTAGGPSSATQAPQLTYDQLRQQMIGQYTRAGGPTAGAPAAAAAPVRMNGGSGENSSGYGGQGGYNAGNYSTGGTDPNNQAGGYLPSTIDEQGLEAAIQQRLAEQTAAQQQAQQAAQSDPAYGRLLQQYTPDTFSFTADDFLKNKDPGYEWRLAQGQQALDRQGAAAGRLLSGRQLQAGSDYNQGAASQEFQASYGRGLTTFGTNEGNRANAWQTNYNNTINPLLSLAGSATLGSQNLGAQGMQMASQLGANITANANAQGAAGLAQANSFSNGLSGAVNGYQQNQLMQRMFPTGVNNNPSVTNYNPITNGRGTSGMGD